MCGACVDVWTRPPRTAHARSARPGRRGCAVHVMEGMQRQPCLWASPIVYKEKSLNKPVKKSLENLLLQVASQTTLQSTAPPRVDQRVHGYPTRLAIAY